MPLDKKMISKLWDVHMVEYYTSNKTNEQVAAIWIYPSDNILSEKNSLQRLNTAGYPFYKVKNN